MPNLVQFSGFRLFFFAKFVNLFIFIFFILVLEIFIYKEFRGTLNSLLVVFWYHIQCTIMNLGIN
jgi:hypothetical protein